MKKLLFASLAAAAAMCITSCNGSNENNNASNNDNDTTTVYQSDINEANGKAFIEKKLAEDSSYIQTESGLVYKVLAPGKGENFTENDVVMTLYKGTHVDGRLFDDGGGQPQEFSCGRVIPGFAEMLLLMKPGMKVEAIIPSQLAYGAQGVKDPNTGEEVIGANETLIFEMETIEKKQ